MLPEGEGLPYCLRKAKPTVLSEEGLPYLFCCPKKTYPSAKRRHNLLPKGRPTILPEEGLPCWLRKAYPIKGLFSPDCRH